MRSTISRVMLLKGQGVPQSRAGFSMVPGSRRTGLAEAQLQLADFYRTGSGVETSCNRPRLVRKGGAARQPEAAARLQDLRDSRPARTGASQCSDVRVVAGDK